MVKRCFWLLFILCSITNLYAKEVHQVVKVDLTKNWQFSQANKNEWKTASVPGTVHQDLISHNALPNPFWGLNEDKIQWVENFDWEYKTTFTLSSEDLAYGGAEIFFEGLDTYADVYLNGGLLFKADNMFVGYKKDVHSLLREGENRIHVYFHSPINYVLPQWASNGFDYPADNDHHEKKLSIFTRKAPYSYGWDWGIRMATSGIWRPVYLSLYDVAKVDDFFIDQKSISSTKAELNIELEINSLEDIDDARLELLYGVDKDFEILVQTISLEKRFNKINLPLEIDNPKLWMPNGWGNPTLYDFGLNLKNKEGEIFASKNVRTGLRSIRLVQDPDSYGNTFYFEVNGEAMFAKGGNYIPDDALLPNITSERYQTLFKDMKDANMNMVRVWGGGTYEDDLFYQLADENGILVWQDFMFGCTTYPHDPVFLKRVEEEAVYNIKRLRNYASLALWCGNNEILEGIKYWGWNKRFSADVYKQMEQGYDILFYDLLANLVSKYDKNRSYVHGSPFSANWGRPESWKSGDSHNWGIWYGRKPFESLDTELARFMSEFGFQSFPEMKTISTFAEPKDYQLESDVMNAHQKSSVGNELIEASMNRYYKVPKEFEDFVYVGLVLQGHGMRHGFEAHRRNKPYCMGTLYWQLNDSWPVVSWSSIDYYGNWKALHYQAKRAFAPLALNAIVEDNELLIYLLSDQLEAYNTLTLEYEVYDFYGKRLSKEEVKDLSITANTSKLLERVELANLINSSMQDKTFLNMKIKHQGRVLVEDQYFFKYTKDLDLPKAQISSKVKRIPEGIELTLKTRVLIKDLFIETPIQGARFSDNFFDLLPGVVKKIKITSRDVEGLQNEKLKFTHIRDTY